MLVGELKKLLGSYPDDMELVVDVPSIEPDDCGYMDIAGLDMSANTKSIRAVFEIESPYI